MNAIVLSAIMVVSLFAGGTVAVAGMGQQTESTASTDITSCTTIDSPGRYTVVEDIEAGDGNGDDICIEIRASDVTVEGNGHTVYGNGRETGVGTARDVDVRNVTVSNLTVQGNENNVRFAGVTGGHLTNVSSGDRIVVVRSANIEIHRSFLESGVDAALVLGNATNVTIANNTFEGHQGIRASELNASSVTSNRFAQAATAIHLRSGSGNTIANNTIPRGTDWAIEVGGHNNSVIGNTIEQGRIGIVISGENHTLTNNRVPRMSGVAVRAEGVNHTIRNNTLSGGESANMAGGAIYLTGAGYEIANNSLSGVHGVYVASATGPISIHHNRFHASLQVRVGESSLCPDPGQVVRVHRNVFELDDYPGNPPHAVLNEDDDVVNATHNYWGADSGPSSPDDETVTDPVTGEPTEGTGMAVSEGVLFDPYLEQPPANMTES